MYNFFFFFQTFIYIYIHTYYNKYFFDIIGLKIDVVRVCVSFGESHDFPVICFMDIYCTVVNELTSQKYIVRLMRIAKNTYNFNIVRN